MSSEAEITNASPKRPPPVPPTRRRGAHLPPTPSSSIPPTSIPAVFSTYLMNDIPNGTSRATLINSLLSPENEDKAHAKHADVQFGLVISNSRLDDELSVASIEFSNTPTWLQKLNNDRYGFPKRTPFGTLWRGVDPNAVDERGQSEFIRAVVNGASDLYYPEMMAEFQDTNVNLQDKQGRTALHWACAMELSVMVKLCLSVPDCDVALRDNDGLTAFDIAPSEKIQTQFYHNIFQMEETAQQDSLLRLLTLTSVPAGEDKPVFPGAALIDSVEHRNPRLVAALIARRVELTARNEQGDTALHIAAAQKDGVEITAMLVDAGADVNALGDGGATPLHRAAHAGQKDIARLLLDHGAQVGAEDHNGATALQLAQDQRNQGLVDLLQGAKHIDQHPVVEMVAEKLHEPIGGLIGDIESKDFWRRTALAQAVVDKDLDRVRALLLLGADVESRDYYNKTPLLDAARVGSRDITNALLEAGANVQAANRSGTTALHFASVKGFTDIVKALLTAGADIEAVSTEKWITPDDVISSQSRGTALDVAALFNRGEIVNALVQAGADINTKCGAGDTALLLMVAENNSVMAKIFIDAGADVEVKDVEGRTSLITAVRNSDVHVTRILVNAGANVNVTDTYRRPALSIAVGNRDWDIVKILIDAGAYCTRSDRVRYLALRTVRYGR